MGLRSQEEALGQLGMVWGRVLKSGLEHSGMQQARVVSGARWADEGGEHRAGHVEGYHLWAGPVRDGAPATRTEWSQVSAFLTGRRPPSEKPGLGRRCRQDMPAWPRHCPEPPASFQPNQRPVS